MIVAITGCIGSGKSFVARHLATLLQAEHCDTDQVCRRLLEKDEAGWRGVVEHWQKRFVDDNGTIDRVKLRRQVFDDIEVRETLERILHPLVRQYLHELEGRCRQEDTSLVVEIPLLFETAWQDHFEKIVTVAAQPEQCLERVVARDKVSREQARKALEAQMDIAEKMRRSHYVIDNSRTIAETTLQVEELSRKLQVQNDDDKGGFFPGKKT